MNLPAPDPDAVLAVMLVDVAERCIAVAEALPGHSLEPAQPAALIIAMQGLEHGLRTYAERGNMVGGEECREI